MVWFIGSVKYFYQVLSQIVKNQCEICILNIESFKNDNFYCEVTVKSQSGKDCPYKSIKHICDVSLSSAPMCATEFFSQMSAFNVTCANKFA